MCVRAWRRGEGCDGYFGITDIVWKRDNVARKRHWMVTRQFSGSYDLTATKRTTDRGKKNVYTSKKERKKKIEGNRQNRDGKRVVRTGMILYAGIRVKRCSERERVCVCAL